MKDGTVVRNAGHYDCDPNLGDLRERGAAPTEIRDRNQDYVAAGRRNAAIELRTMEVAIDRLAPERLACLRDYSRGT